MDKIMRAVGCVEDNVWAFALFVLAAGLAIIAHKGHDRDLFMFAQGMSTTGAAVMHTKDKKDDKAT